MPQSARTFSPFKYRMYGPPPGLPHDLQAVHKAGYGLLCFTEVFLSDYKLFHKVDDAQLRIFYSHINRDRDELTIWMMHNEGTLYTDASDLLNVCERILGEVQPLYTLLRRKLLWKKKLPTAQFRIEVEKITFQGEELEEQLTKCLFIFAKHRNSGFEAGALEPGKINPAPAPMLVSEVDASNLTEGEKQSLEQHLQALAALRKAGIESPTYKEQWDWCKREEMQVHDKLDSWSKAVRRALKKVSLASNPDTARNTTSSAVPRSHFGD